MNCKSVCNLPNYPASRKVLDHMEDVNESANQSDI